jgi:ABC-type amino acid transport substrate-binding protein
MPAHYNLRSFLRQLSRELLNELLEHHAIDIDLDLSALKKRQIDPIFAAVNALPDDRRQPGLPA